MKIRRILRLARRIREKGVYDAIAIVVYRNCWPVFPLFRRRSARKIHEIINNNGRYQPIIIIKSPLDYSFPYSQRPHHLARAFGNHGALVFFISPCSGYDREFTVRKIAENIYLTPHLGSLLQESPTLALFVLSTDVTFTREQLAKAWSKGVVVYDYIDSLDGSISNGAITSERLAIHKELLEREKDTICVASASLLFDEITRSRSRRMALVENGVDTAHFKTSRSRDFQSTRLLELLNGGRPIAGYFGALAAWLDYELVRRVAELLPHVNFVFIGHDYDGSLKELESGPANILILPPVDYAVLPCSAVWFDVALLPFKINEITLATSPLKLFEYMALGLPVVSTPIPEVRKYRGVLIADDPDSFARAIVEGLSLKNNIETQLTLAKEAASNDWNARAATILRLITDDIYDHSMRSGSGTV